MESRPVITPSAVRVSVISHRAVELLPLLHRALLSATIAIVSVIAGTGMPVAHATDGPGPAAALAIASATSVQSSSQARSLDAYAATLARIGDALRAGAPTDRNGRARTVDAPRPGVWNDPVTQAERVLTLAADLAGLELALDAQLASERGALRDQRLDPSFDRAAQDQHELIRARLATFREDIAALQVAVRSGERNAITTRIQAMAARAREQGDVGGFQPLPSEAARNVLPKPLSVQAALDAPTLAARTGLPATSGNTVPATPGPGDLAESAEVQLTPSIRARAAELGNDPVRIRDWVANNIAYVPSYGFLQGSDLTLLNRRGNAFDQASLLIALLRAAGTPARYVYGTVELPAEKLRRLTLAPTVPMAVNLMQKAGIPTTAVITAGAISAVRIETVWVEAWIDFIPSRGAVNRVPETWVPLDVAIKEQTIQEPLPLASLAPFNPTEVAEDFLASATVSPDGLSATRYDIGLLDTPLLQHAEAIRTHLETTAPDARISELYRAPRIVPQSRTSFEGTHPYRVVATGQRFSAAPDALMHFVNVQLYYTQTDWNLQSPGLTWRIAAPRIGTRILGVRYAPANPATAQALQSYVDNNATSMPLSGLSVVPTIELDGVAQANGGPTAMGTQHLWDAFVTSPLQAWGNSFEPYRFAAGTEAVFSFDAAGITPQMMRVRAAGLSNSRQQPLREGMNMAGLAYWFWHRRAEQQSAETFGGISTPIASIGAFFAPLNVRYYFGIPRTGSMNGYATDVKSVRYAMVAPDADAERRINLSTGAQGSLHEGTAWEQILGLPTGSGLSSSSFLLRANDDGVSIYTVTQANIAQVLPRLQISGDARAEIQSVVAAGYHVTVAERELRIGGISGTGYVVFDPNTGAGLYRVDGGTNGYLLAAACLAKAIFLNCVFDKLLWFFYDRMIGSLVRLAGNTRLGALLSSPVPGTRVPIGLAQAQHYIMFMALHLTMTEIAIALATDDLEGLALAYGIDLPAIEASLIACWRPGNCFGPGFGPGGGPGSGPGFGGGFGGGGHRGPSRGNPGYTAAGEKVQFETDYIGTGGPFPLQLVRTYDSYSPLVSTFGFQWRHSYERKLDIRWRQINGVDQVDALPQAVLVIRGDGSYMEFVGVGNALRTQADYPTTLTRLTDATGRTTGFSYVNEFDETETYTANGRLTSIRNRAGVLQTLQYAPDGLLSAVIDASGRELRFTYNDFGQLQSVTDPDGDLIRYAYSPRGMLETVTHTDGRTRRYHYEGLRAGHLTGITDERGVRLSTYRYDTRGRIIETARADGADRFRFRYLGDLKTEITDPLGTVSVLDHVQVYDGSFRMIRNSRPCGTCGTAGSASESYDARGFLERAVDFNGNRTTYAHDARGLMTRMTEAEGTPLARITTVTWHPQFRLPLTVTETAASTGTVVTESTYDPAGNRIRQVVRADGQSRTWTWTYNPAGQVLTEDGPRTDVADLTTWTYRPDGYIATRTDAAGHVWRYEAYDADGQVTRMVDPNGLITQYRYDERRRLVETIEDDESTTYQYDEAGQLTRITLPDGTFIAYTYDGAGRLTGLTDALGNRVAYTLDGMGNRTKEDTYDPSNQLAQTASRVYDALGRLERAIGADNQITRWEYDPNGNDTALVDARDQRTTSTYDALDRLITTTDPLTGRIGYTYDAQDNLRTVTDPRNRVTTYTYNGYDELTRLDSPDTGVTEHTYDPSGNLLTRRDARGVVSTHTYDALDRLTAISYPAFAGQPAETVAYTYDATAAGNAGRGRLTSVTDGSGSTAYAYDVHGRVTAKTQVVGAGASASTRTLATSYEANGRIEGHVLPSGAVIRYSYRADGRVLSIRVNGVEIVREVEYHPLGEVRAWRYNTSDRYQRVFDRDGRIREHSAGPATRSLSFDPASRITAISDGAGSPNQWAYAYDNLDRLTGAQNAAAAGPVAGLNLGWAYDPTGNRTSETRTGTPTPYIIDPASNRLTQVGSASRSYDATGNTTNDGNGLASVYSARNRLIQTTRAGATTAYAYNAFGERVCKASNAASCPAAAPSARTEYIYTDDGQLIGEYTPTAADGYEVLWIDTTPVAVLKRRPGSANGGPTGGGSASPWLGQAAGGVEVFFIHPDHLDTPRVITNAANQPVWRWDSAPFGDTAALERPTATIAADFRFNLRFPGQLLDAETGTHYNYFRDYEPGMGRYVQSDPIGLDDGPNTYAYVGSDPYTFIDYSGEGRSGRGGGSGKPGGHTRDPTSGLAIPNCPCGVGDKRSHNYEGLKNVYEIIGPSGEVHKVGIGTGSDLNRCEKQRRVLMKANPGKTFRCIAIKFVCGTRRAEHHEFNRQDGLRGGGNSLPGNSPRRRPR